MTTDEGVTVEAVVHVPVVEIGQDPDQITREADAQCPDRAPGPDQGTKSRQNQAVITTRAVVSVINVIDALDHVPHPTASIDPNGIAQGRVHRRAHLHPASPLPRANRRQSGVESER